MLDRIWPRSVFAVPPYRVGAMQNIVFKKLSFRGVRAPTLVLTGPVIDLVVAEHNAFLTH